MSELEFRALFEAMPVATLVLRPDPPRFTIAAVTDVYLQATMSVRDGPRGIVGQGIFEAFPDPPGDPDATGERNLSESLYRVLDTRAPDVMAVQHYDIRRPDGVWEERHWSPINLPLLDRDGAVRCILHRVEDVTDMVHLRRRAQDKEKAELASARAEEANAAKSRFLAAMSHDLRTPLNAISGYTDLLEAGVYGAPSDGQRKALDAVRRSSKHLITLIDRVLGYAKLEAGSLQVQLERVALCDVLRDTEALVTPQARAAGLNLAVDCNHSAEARGLCVRADPHRLREILINLVGNSVKFTAAGGTIAVDCEPEDDQRVAIHVSDNGRGIAPDHLEHVFEPFVQVGTPGLTAGTGLGLAISRELTRAMGGDIRVQSRPGVGSTFTIVLPAA